MATLELKNNQKVKLRANKEEGWEAEWARVIEDHSIPDSQLNDYTLIVTLEGPLEKDDDGLREITADQIDLSESPASVDVDEGPWFSPK